MPEIKILGKMDHTLDNTLESANRVYDSCGVSPTLNTCSGGGHEPKIITEDGKTGQYRIRKPTPLEYFRLMGVSEVDAMKMLSVNSPSQCYKQAGNSIITTVLMALFSQLNIKGVQKWNDMSEDEIWEMIKNVNGTV